MYIFPTKIIKLSTLFIAILLSFSCNKDADLLTDYVLSDSINAADSAGNVANDHFEVLADRSTIFNVLLNDKFKKNQRVKVIHTSTPRMGTVKINADNTITYTPSTVATEPAAPESTTPEPTSPEPTSPEPTTPEPTTPEPTSPEPTTPEPTTPAVETPSTTESVTDTFTYTTEVVNEDQTASNEVGTVEVVVTPDPVVPDPIVPDPVTPESNPSNAKLLFASGFEDGTRLSAPNGAYKYFSGTDAGTGFTWPITALGGATDPRLQHIGGLGTNVFSEIQTVTGHLGGNTKALYREVVPANEPGGNFRQVAHQLNGMTASNQKIYVKMWMKVDATSFTGTNRYRAIWEYKTYGYEQPAGGFRVAAYMNMDSNGNESWEFRGDTKPGFAGVVWSASNKTIPFPKEEWFKLEYFIDFKVDGSATGRVWMKINDQLIGDKANVQTSRNNQKMQALFLTNLYGANGNIHSWIDDLEIWDDVPY